MTAPLCTYVRVRAGIGTGMSHHAATRCAWWCIISRPLHRGWEVSTCSNGMTTTAKPSTISSANTQQVYLTCSFETLGYAILLMFLLLFVCFVFSPDKSADPSPPNSTHAGKMRCHLIGRYFVLCAFPFFNTFLSFSPHSIILNTTVLTGCVFFVMTDTFPSSVPWNPSNHNAKRSTG